MFKSGVVAHAYNPRTWEPEAGRSRVQGQPGLYCDTLSQKQHFVTSL